MIEMQIDITDLEDARHIKNQVALQSILGAAQAVLAASGRVILKRSYSNAPDEVFRVYLNEIVFSTDWQQWFISAAKKV